MEGALSKWTNVMKGWQYRWFVLDANVGLLSYYTSREKMVKGARRGCVRLNGAMIGIHDEYDSTFTITVDSKTFHFQARDSEERERWVRCLEDTILRQPYGCKSPNTLRLPSYKPSLSMQDFDKKLSEADVYLLILLDQSQRLEKKIDSELELEEKSKYDLILTNTNNLLQQVQHTITLLKISRNSAHLENVTYNLVESKISVVGLANCSTLSYPSLSIPDKSYSSSEEDYFDAHDNSDSPTVTMSGTTSPELNNPRFEGHNNNQQEGESKDNPDRNLTPGTSSSPATFQWKSSGNVNYDALYDDPEGSTISMETQGSVIAHLLSQVKIGMDLTKVTLPTFILERRSLLEMYADYFAHPDMFVKITDLSSQRDRMVQVVKWYLCSYHAGRKSSVAKKPYNPVLGELFQCHWDVPGLDPSVDEAIISDGPVPWCHGNQLTFVAEQVSHHPPISAFYAEHYNKKISLASYIWTKSKFLGLSIGVHNIGCGIINVIKYDEKYNFTFPSGYGRSILTIPWIELGGTVTITCEKTGYRASIEFLTKPFYGGKKHRINSEVYAPNEKKPFLTINGEWNGMMEEKWADGTSGVFADVNKLILTKKIVRPITEQMENESRKLWKEVTTGLMLNNVDQATNAKYSLEQKQRFEAQKRKELGIEWVTKCFHREGEDSWVYMNPLSQRLNYSSKR